MCGTPKIYMTKKFLIFVTPVSVRLVWADAFRNDSINSESFPIKLAKIYIKKFPKSEKCTLIINLSQNLKQFISSSIKPKYKVKLTIDWTTFQRKLVLGSHPRQVNSNLISNLKRSYFISM